MKYKTVLKEVASRKGKNILDYKEDGKYDKAPALYRYINTTIPNAIQRIKKPLEFFAKDVKIKIEVDGEDFLIDQIMKESIYKWWRTDLNLWEEQKVFFWFITYYKYTIWKDGKVKKQYKLIKYKGEKYIKKPFVITPEVGKEEFQKDYKSNRFLVPINYELNLNKQ